MNPIYKFWCRKTEQDKNAKVSIFLSYIANVQLLLLALYILLIERLDCYWQDGHCQSLHQTQSLHGASICKV